MNTQRIELDISKPDALTAAVTIGQGDKAGTTIIATIYDNGVLASLSGLSAQFECRLPDGRSYVRDANCTVSGHEITYVMDEEHVASVAGATDEAYFTILDGTQEVYSTNRFRLKVLRSAHDGAVPAESWDTAVDELIERGNAALEEYAEAEEDREEAETSRATAETARATAETARQTAETARNSAESSRADAEAQRSINEADRAEEEAERASAETAREAAEGLRASAETARASADATRQQHQDTNDAHQSQNDSAQADNDTDQARNNADQALNNQAAQGLVTVILTSGQYNPTSLKPTITGEVGKIYLVPNGSVTGDHYLEWLWLGSEWECMGSTQTTIEGITTSNIDAVADDEAPQGNSVLTLTGLSYLWTKIKDFVATAILGKQDRLTAGSNVQISNNTISATDTKYTAGAGIDITGNTISVIFDAIYPKGSIYMSTEKDTSGRPKIAALMPNATWERITGRFLLAATDSGGTGGNSTASVRAGYTGGEAAHQLTVSELAKHSHTVGIRIHSYSGTNTGNRATYAEQAGDFASANDTGGDQAHNTMPPYLAVYVWKRTA